MLINLVARVVQDHFGTPLGDPARPHLLLSKREQVAREILDGLEMLGCVRLHADPCERMHVGTAEEIRRIAGLIRSVDPACGAAMEEHADQLAEALEAAGFIHSEPAPAGGPLLPTFNEARIAELRAAGLSEESAVAMSME